MTTTANIGYIHTNFKYPILTQIKDVPNYEDLIKSKNESKTNIDNIQYHLRNKNNRNPGLVSTNTKYAAVLGEAEVL